MIESFDIKFPVYKPFHLIVGTQKLEFLEKDLKDFFATIRVEYETEIFGVDYGPMITPGVYETPPETNSKSEITSVVFFICYDDEKITEEVDLTKFWEMDPKIKESINNKFEEETGC